MKLILATRKSILAQTQTDMVIEGIKNKHEVECEKLLIETLGDKILDRTLDKIGGKGLFIKEIEAALLEDKAHIAVHSMKDMPYELHEELKIAAVPEREDVRDVFISNDGTPFMELPKGAKVGTSSRRRASQLKLLREDIEIVPIRGNVQTRIRKIKELGLNGTVLAAAGLNRLDMKDVATHYFEINQMIPAIGQGALGVETRIGARSFDYVKHLDHTDTRICVEAERSFMKELKGDCQSTIGAHAKLYGDMIYMVGIYEIGGRIIKKDIEGKREEFINLGKNLAKKITMD